MAVLSSAAVPKASPGINATLLLAQMILVLTAAPARLMAVLTSVSVQMVSPDRNVRSRLAHLIPVRMMVSVRS